MRRLSAALLVALFFLVGFVSDTLGQTPPPNFTLYRGTDAYHDHWYWSRVDTANAKWKWYHEWYMKHNETVNDHHLAAESDIWRCSGMSFTKVIDTATQHSGLLAGNVWSHEYVTGTATLNASDMQLPQEGNEASAGGKKIFHNVGQGYCGCTQFAEPLSGMGIYLHNFTNEYMNSVFVNSGTIWASPGDVVPIECYFFYSRNSLQYHYPYEAHFPDDSAPRIHMQYWNYSSSAWQSDPTVVFDTADLFESGTERYGVEGQLDAQFTVLSQALFPQYFEFHDSNPDYYEFKLRSVLLLKDDTDVWRELCNDSQVTYKYYPQ